MIRTRARARARTSSDGATRIFRAMGATVAGWAWMAFVGLNLIDLALRGRDLAALVATVVLLFGCAVAYTLLIRPRIVAEPAEVRILNPLRTVRVPWRALRGVELTGATEAITFRCGDEEFRAWVLQSSPRSQRGRARKRRAGAGPGAGRVGRVGRVGRSGPAIPAEVAKAVEDRTHTAFVVDQLNESAAGHSRGRSAAPDASAQRPSVRWAPDAVAALGVTGGLLIAVLTVAVLA